MWPNPHVPEYYAKHISDWKSHSAFSFGKNGQNKKEKFWKCEVIWVIFSHFLKATVILILLSQFYKL